jgi:hypothetical protein
MKHRILTMAALATILTAALPAMGQDAGFERNLGGHAFQPSLYVDDPWIDTNFRNVTGGGMTLGYDTPFYNLDGEEIFRLEGTIFYVAVAMGFQQKLGDSWAVGVNYAANARAGTNANSLVAEGANVDRNLNLYLKKRLLRTESSQLTVGLGWRYEKAFLVSPRNYVDAILGGDDLDSPSLLSDVKSWTARLKVDYAHAFSPTYGLRANLAMGLYEVPFTEDVSKATHRAGVIMEMDLNPKHAVPLGLSLGYTFGLPDSDPTAGLSGLLAGLWYTGSDALALGAEMGFMKQPVYDREDLDALFGLFTLRYYF